MKASVHCGNYVCFCLKEFDKIYCKIHILIPFQVIKCLRGKYLPLYYNLKSRICKVVLWRIKKKQVALTACTVSGKLKYSSQFEQLRFEGENRIFPKQSADRRRPVGLYRLFSFFAVSGKLFDSHSCQKNYVRCQREAAEVYNEVYGEGK